MSSNDGMTGLLAGRHALVTGASRGIGAAVATALMQDGAKVTLLGRDSKRLEVVARQLGNESVALPVQADVTDGQSVRIAFEAARRAFGPVHILINNAGQAASAKFINTDEALWNRLFAVNVTGTYLCTRAAVPDMLQAGFGRIVNIASTAGLHGAPLISAYVSSKHAVVGFTRALALEYATRQITVNAVCPGYVDTDIVTESVAHIMSKTGRSESEARQALIDTNPLKRLLTADEVAETVRWLCRPGSESITGQAVVLGGNPA